MWEKSYDGTATLYLIPTPIGNMEDMTYRGVRILSEVEVVFSEDTRVTQNLLRYFNINKKLISLHNFNEDRCKEKVLEYLKNGYNVGLVTDRGTPIISDPGYKTVKYVSDNGYRVVGLPGANAFVPALIVSGIAPQPFLFYGFLDSKMDKRRKELEKLKFYDCSLIFYEAPHRILVTMKLMYEIFGNRNVSLSREISKKFESVYRGNIVDLIPTLSDVKGEFVIVVDGNHDTFSNDGDLGVVEQVHFYINSGMSKMDAIKQVARERNLKKNDVYSMFHNERGDS